MLGAMSTGAQQLSNPNNDVVVPSSPDATVSSLHFGTGASSSLLLSTSWSKDALIWDVSATGVSPKARVTAAAPLLCSTFCAADPSRVFVGGCDREVRAWNLSTSQLSTVGQHAAPVKELFFSPDLNCLVSGSWDKTIKYWDVRTPNGQAQATVPVTDRVFCMDQKGAVLVVGTADKKLAVFDLRKPSVPFRPAFESPLKFQSRCVSVFPNFDGFAVGSIEGRVGIQHMVDKDKDKNFAFKCHREEANVYSVNCITFHAQFGTFATCGSDGTYVFWDKDSKQRLKLFLKLNNAITSAAFNATGNVFAYAVGYDWSRGIEYYDRQKQPNAILLHAVKEEEIKKKQATR